MSRFPKRFVCTLVVSCLVLSSLMAWPTSAGSKSSASQENKTLLEQWENSTAVSQEQKEISEGSVAYIDETIKEIDEQLRASKKSAKDVQTAYDKLKDKYVEQSEKLANETRAVKPYMQGSVGYEFDNKVGLGIGGGIIVKDNLMVGAELETKDVTAWNKLGSYAVKAKLGWIF